MYFSIALTKETLEEYRALLSNNKLSELDFVFRHKNMPVEVRSFLAAQIKLRKKAEKKHPNFFKSCCFYLEQALEQSTAYWVARHKAALFQQNSTLLVCDLTGGMGAESVAFADNGNQVVYIEPHKELFDISNYNFERLGLSAQIELMNTNAEDFLLQNVSAFDLTLLDPDRRAQGIRDFTLENSSPNPLLLEEEILKKSRKLLVKHSPLIDIQYLREQFNFLQTVFVFSFRNEVKEVTTLHTRGDVNDTKVVCICIDSKGVKSVVAFNENADKHITHVNSGCKEYFFEPDKAIIKSGYASLYASRLGLELISPGIPYFTSENVPHNFIGRIFEVKEVVKYNNQSIKEILNKYKIVKASIGARGFSLKADEIEKKFQLKPDDTHHLFFYINKDGEKEVVLCETYLPKASI